MFVRRFRLVSSIVAVHFLWLGCSHPHGVWKPDVMCNEVYNAHLLDFPLESGAPVPVPDQNGSEMDATGTGLPESLTITVDDAVILALRNNRALITEKLNPQIRDTYVSQEKSAFDPGMEGQISIAEDREIDGDVESRTKSTLGKILVSEALPLGTSFEMGMTVNRTRDASPEYTTETTLTATQSLLQGFGYNVNRVMIRQAEIDSAISEFELRGFAESLISEVEDIYWDYVLAQNQVRIVEESLNLVQQEMDETKQRILVGTLAETELVAVEAEHALQLEALINACSNVDILRVKLLRLIHPELMIHTGSTITALSEPTVPPSPLEPLENHLELAFRLRPDLNQAMLQRQKGDIELIKTRNGLLPKLDLFIQLGRTGYADSFHDSIQTGPDRTDSVEVGLTFDASLLNRSARSRQHRALLTQQQLRISLINMKDLVRQDVELAYIDVKRTRQQVDATAGTSRLQKEKLRVETAKFHAGKTTAYFVAQAHRDLLGSEVEEVRAIVNYLKACNHLYLMEGSLLERRGIAVGHISSDN